MKRSSKFIVKHSLQKCIDLVENLQDASSSEMDLIWQTGQEASPTRKVKLLFLIF